MKKTLTWFLTKYSADDVSAHSAQVSFFIIVSFFPFVLFLLTLLQYTPISSNMVIELVNAVLPNSLSGIANGWINELYGKSASTILSVTMISALWAGSKGFMGIQYGIQKVYNVKETKNWVYVRLLSIVYMLVFALMIVFTLLLLVYGNKILSYIAGLFPFLNNLYLGAFSLRAVAGLTMFMIFFVTLYSVLPARHVNIRHQVPGALFASVLWIGFSYLYSIYISYYVNFSSLYGSLTYIVLFMLWLFFCINFIFIGAEINVYLEEHPWHRPKLFTKKSKKQATSLENND